MKKMSTGASKLTAWPAVRKGSTSALPGCEFKHRAWDHQWLPLPQLCFGTLGNHCLQDNAQAQFRG